jgi:TonB family protein
MKKLILILAVMQLFLFSIYAQTPADDKEKLKQLNAEVISKYKAGKIDDAVAPAKQAVELSLKVFGAENNETASAYVNLGTLYRLKKKYKEATENLQKAVAIYNLKPAANGKSLAKTMDNLALAYALDGDKKRAGETYVQSLTVAENTYGKESADVVPFLRSLANFYAVTGKADEAQEMFVRLYKTAAKNSKSEEDKKQLQEIEDEFTCFAVQTPKPDESLDRDAKFREAIRTDEEKESSILKGGIINGKAKNLVKPEYPSTARDRMAQGVVPVRVTIDENGNVTEAQAICGDRELKISGENAARKSKFNPTILNGQAVKITGILVYRFFR